VLPSSLIGQDGEIANMIRSLGSFTNYATNVELTAGLSERLIKESCGPQLVGEGIHPWWRGVVYSRTTSLRLSHDI